MKIIFRAAALVMACATLTACITPQSYVDPQYRKARYEVVQRPAQPTLVKVETKFLRNGERYPAADAELRGHVERALRATGVFTPSLDANPATIAITANNIADLASARAKGFGTGLTFGAAGSTVVDNYEFTFSYHDHAGQEHESTYRHAIHTTVGRAEGPAGLTPTTAADAFGKVVEDVILNFVKDLQDEKMASGI